MASRLRRGGARASVHMLGRPNYRRPAGLLSQAYAFVAALLELLQQLLVSVRNESRCEARYRSPGEIRQQAELTRELARAAKGTATAAPTQPNPNPNPNPPLVHRCSGRFSGFATAGSGASRTARAPSRTTPLSGTTCAPPSPPSFPPPPSAPAAPLSASPSTTTAPRPGQRISMAFERVRGFVSEAAATGPPALLANAPCERWAGSSCRRPCRTVAARGAWPSGGAAAGLRQCWPFGRGRRWTVRSRSEVDLP